MILSIFSIGPKPPLEIIEERLERLNFKANSYKILKSVEDYASFGYPATFSELVVEDAIGHQFDSEYLTNISNSHPKLTEIDKMLKIDHKVNAAIRRGLLLGYLGFEPCCLISCDVKKDKK
jgi:hypothetical protein